MELPLHFVIRSELESMNSPKSLRPLPPGRGVDEGPAMFEISWLGAKHRVGCHASKDGLFWATSPTVVFSSGSSGKMG